MMHENKIAIISPVSLLAYGIRQLLAEYFSLTNLYVFKDVKELMKNQADSFDLYFIHPEPVLLNCEFFLPRRTKTVLLTENNDTHSAFFCLSLTADLSSTIDDLQTLLEKIVFSKDAERQDELSVREVEVLKLIARGLINKEIADELCISLNTVLTHRKNITAKLGIKTVSGLTFYAMLNGYIVE